MSISSTRIFGKFAVYAVVASFAAPLAFSAFVIAQSASSTTNPAGKPPAFPLKVSGNHRYVVDQTGSPFLIVGDTPQGLLGRLTEKEAEYYFADREAHGFNTLGWIDIEVAGHDYPDNKDGTTPDGIRPFTGYVAGGTDYTHYDIRKPNEPYFVRLDHIVQLAANHHLAVFLAPMETIGWLATLRNNGLKAAYAYGQYVGKRYGGFQNVYWLNGNDFNNWTVPQDDNLVQAVSKGIRSVAPNQLQTVELHVRTSSSFDDPRWIPLIELNSVYTYSPTYIQMLHSYNQQPIAPAYLVEAHYDLENVGEPPDFGTPLVLRKEDYWTMLTGGIGQFYGNMYTWSFKDGWKQNIDTPGVEQLGYWKSFFSAIPWQDLVPDQNHSVLTAGYGSFGNVDTRVSESDYATAAGTPDGATIVVYIPTVRAVTIDMAQMRGSAKARWFDPSNGQYRDASEGPFPNKGPQQFTPPGKNHAGDEDWVLLLEASGSGQ
jgi:Protein of unknown function (DUF4038)/Putative collagen-binding domain of a collagenase